jgi:16S rRNA (guanine966-N2)-methyltransferase
MIKIIGGKFKKKKIDVHNNHVRPTSALKREAIFSILESNALKNSFDPYRNKCFIDLFAGSGSLGLEAISRGGSFSYFFEFNNEVYKTLKDNCKNLCNAEQFFIYEKDVTNIDKFKIDYPLSAIFIDPPYKLNPFDSILKKIVKSKILSNDSLIIIETDKNNLLEFSTDIKIIKEKIYGKTKIIFLKKLR